MNGRIWMAARVALALVLMAGFYLLSLGLGVGLLWLAYAEVVYARVRSPKLLMLTAGSGLLVLWALFRGATDSYRPAHASPRTTSPPCSTPSTRWPMRPTSRCHPMCSSWVT